MATFELTLKERKDGSSYITCEALPGFHYILWPNDDIETTLKPAFSEFLALYEAARIRARQRLRLRPRQTPRGFTAELEVA